MNPDRLGQVEQIFCAAIELPADRRASFLAEQCAGDDELRREVETLLGHATASIGMLDVPPVAAPIGVTFSHEPERLDAALPPDKQIGSYRVLRYLGAGGMGVVYLAEQQRPRRTVALKVIRGASPSLLRRFEHEAEILGRMHHPGIANIYEAGVARTDAGPQPFLAMELVDGPPITDFADARRLPSAERLALIARVCDGVHHAHQRGVIHRDLKPSNILVDAHGQPKILDFGVARAIDADLQITTLRTSVGQLIGTLPYMSPEQIAADPAEIDNRADVYALGVLTFELLTGRLPFDLRSRSIPEAARIIRDESPTRLSAVDRTLRGDIETIVAKALSKEKDRRYQSAAELAEDIRRHLTGEPIAAREATAAQLLRRSLRRYRGAVAAGVVAILSLTAIALHASIQSTRNRALASSEAEARREETLARRQAEEQRRITAELNERLRDQLETSIIERGRAEGVALNGPGAENVLWPALLANPDSRPAYWALWELSSRFPCLWSSNVPEGAMCVGPSPDGRLIAVGSPTGRVHLFLTEGGGSLGSVGVDPPGRQAAVLQVGFTGPDTLVSAHADGRARAWGVGADALAPLGEWVFAESPVSAVAISSDGGTLAVATTGGEVSLYSLISRSRVLDLARCETPVDALAISPSLDRVALGLRDGTVSLCAARPGAEARALGRRNELFRSLTFSGDGEALYSSAHTAIVTRWDTSDGSQRQHSRGSVDARRVAINPSDGRVLVVRTLSLAIDPAPGVEPARVGYPVHSFIEGAWVGDRVVTVETGGEVRLWEDRPSPALHAVGEHGNWVFSVAFDPDGQRLVSASGDGTIGVWPTDGGERIAALQLPPRTRSRMALFNADGSRIAVACGDGLVRFADPATGLETHRFGPVGAEIYAIAYSPGFDSLAAASINGVVTVFDATTGDVRGQASGLNSNCRSVAYSPDGARLYTSGAPEGVLVWDASTLERIELLPTTTEPWSVAASPDGRTLAVGTFGATVELFDLRTGARTIGLARHHLVVAGLAFSPDGAMLASGGDDGTVKLWDPATAKLLASLDALGGPIPGVAFSRDGARLACATAAGVAEYWDLTHHNRHLASNLESALRRFPGAPAANLDRLRDWARGSPRPAAHADSGP